MAQRFQTTFSPSLGNMTDASDRILQSTIATFKALHLEKIDDGWVQEIWESQVNVNSGLQTTFDNFKSIYHLRT